MNKDFVTELEASIERVQQAHAGLQDFKVLNGVPEIIEQFEIILIGKAGCSGLYALKKIEEDRIKFYVGN